MTVIADDARELADANWMRGLSVPSHWKRQRVKHLVRSMRAGNAITVDAIESAGTYPVYGANGLRGFTSHKTHCGTHVLIGRQGALCGNVHLVSGDFWASEHAIVATPASKVDARWLAALLHVMNLGQYSTSAAQPGIGVGQVAPLVVYVPPLDEQRAIADFLDHETAQINALVAKQKECIDLLRERRRTIIQHALQPVEDWKTSQIKHLAQTSLGKMLDAGRALREGDELAPYVRAADILADGTIRLTNLNEMPFSADEMAYFDLQRDDVLLIEGGATVGRPGYLAADAPGIAFQKTVNRLRSGPDLNARFAYWSMLMLYESDYYANYFGSVSFVHLTGEKLREIPLSHPNMDEQHRIATYLDGQTTKIDALIAKAQEHIVLAKERRAALITAAVTGQFDVRTARKAG